MANKHTVGDAIAGILLLAAIYVMVRPSSKGVDLVKGMGSALTAITAAATDLAAP